ncbi:MAG TPA: phosphoribosylamine--glycine ligase [Thermomicrobiales bacterium]|nr:phosphoribosylamine--glycine ligase [Thermomicrobiales bacterium]
MRVLVIGSGGREHAVVWKLARSAVVSEIVCAPGNPGIEAIAECVPIPVMDLDRLVTLAVDRMVDLVVIGPEDPLAAGLADRLTASGIAVAGHSAAAARIESSKAWAKGVMTRAGIPIARSLTASSLADGLRAIAEIGGDGPVVIKADGLAAGKGVVVAGHRAEADAALTAMIQDRAFGAAGSTVVIEERLTGQEVSILALTDGTAIRTLAPSCDHKRLGDGDTGPNTGGMGVYTPTRHVDAALLRTIHDRILEPAVRDLREQGTPLRGVLYAGLMLTADGPRVIEFNARFGDPETQVVLPTLQGDLGRLLHGVATGTLADVPEPVHSGAAVGVILASGGYPGPYPTGFPISGLEHMETMDDVLVFHAGTKRAGGRLVTAGGRVLTVVGLGGDVRVAHDRAYEAVARISFEGRQFRSDIAHRELA